MTKVAVAGYGSTLRGDDGAGFEVARAIAEGCAADRADVRVLLGVQPLPEWAAELAEADVAYFVDAAPTAGLGAAGVEVIPIEPAPAPTSGILDGHAAGPAALLDLAKVLYGRAPRAFLVTVPAEIFGYSDELSTLAASGVGEAVRLLERRVAAELEAPPCA
jgi:hydrogenase maturation protease